MKVVEKLVCVDGAGRVGKRGHLTHLNRRSKLTPGVGDDRDGGARQPGRSLLARGQPSSRHDQVAVVLREAFREPELARDVGLFEIEWLERFRTDALDVPAVEELVRHGIEHVGDHARRSQRDRRGDNRAVPVLHPIPAAPRNVVAEERIGAGVELGKLAEHRPLLANDLLRALHILIHFRIAGIVMNRGPNREFLAVGIADLEAADGLGAQLGRAVHQVLQVGRRERQRIARGKQLCRRHPRRSFRRLERDAHSATVEPAGPQQRRRHVHVRVRRIDAEIRAVDVIAVNLVDDSYRAVVAGDVPLIGARPRRRQRLSLAVERLQLEDVLGVFVQRVPARRRSTHARLERPGGQVGEYHFDLRVVMFRRRKGDAVGDGRLRQRRQSRADDAETYENRRQEPGRTTHEWSSRKLGS